LLEKETLATQHASWMREHLAQEQLTQATLTWTEAQLQNHQQSIQVLQSEINALKQSTSWRITAPLRKLMRKLSD